jgi:hypothetical protein
LQVAVAGIIIGLVAAKLNRVEVNLDPENLTAGLTNTCLLGQSYNGLNLCTASYIVCGISLVATLALGFLQCITCNMCGLGVILDTAFAAAGTALWALAGVVLTQSRNLEQNKALISALPADKQSSTVTMNNIILYLAWAACALFAIMFLACLWRMLSTLCCKGSCGGSKKREVVEGPTKIVIAQPQSYAQYPPKQQQFMAADTSGYWNTHAARY